MIEDKWWVYFGNGNKVNNIYWHTWDRQIPSNLNNNNWDVQTFANLPKWVERGLQVIFWVHTRQSIDNNDCVIYFHPQNPLTISHLSSTLDPFREVGECLHISFIVVWFWKLLPIPGMSTIIIYFFSSTKIHSPFIFYNSFILTLLEWIH